MSNSSSTTTTPTAEIGPKQNYHTSGSSCDWAQTKLDPQTIFWSQANYDTKLAQFLLGSRSPLPTSGSAPAHISTRSAKFTCGSISCRESDNNMIVTYLIWVARFTSGPHQIVYLNTRIHIIYCREIFWTDAVLENEKMGLNWLCGSYFPWTQFLAFLLYFFRTWRSCCRGRRRIAD